MKSFAVGAIALIVAAQAENLFDVVEPHREFKMVSDIIEPASQNVSKNKFGCLVEEAIFDYPYVEKKITAPLIPFEQDYSQQETFLN